MKFKSAIVLLVIMAVLFLGCKWTTVNVRTEYKNPQKSDFKKKQVYFKQISNDEYEVTAFEEIFLESPESYYGQLSLLELGKLEILKRDYEKAISYLNQIHHPRVLEKEYWLSEAYFKIGEFSTAIIASQNYIYSSENHDKIELAYFIISESYIQMKNYTKALNTLDYLRNSEYINNNIPLLHFKMGYCYEQSGNIDKAALSYKKLKKEFPYHQYTYQAEERMNNLGNPSVDPTLLDNPEIQVKKQIVEESKDKVISGRFLQVGVFGSKNNADKMISRIDEIFPGKSASFPRKNNGKIQHVVAAGPFDSDDEINIAKARLSEKNISSFEIVK